jgi:DNA-binding GntR family transcriptional regulator
VLGRNIAEKCLRDAITRGEMAPGQRLIEAELGERFGVTRNSARLALDVLVADGLVERVPNRGARVRTIPTAEAVAILECRMVLDGLLCRKAAENATDAEIERLVANGLIASGDGVRQAPRRSEDALWMPEALTG